MGRLTLDVCYRNIMIIQPIYKAYSTLMLLAMYLYKGRQLLNCTNSTLNEEWAD